MIRLALILVLGLTGMVSAEERSSLWPSVPAATGEPHAEGNEFWRKNHMDMMRHDRDLTMRMGDRQVGASLKACFDCHTVRDDEGHVVTYRDERHFCRSCHDFAAVRVDCFTCHRSTPDGVDEGEAHAMTQAAPAEPGAIAAFLNRLAGQTPMTFAGAMEANR
ncbi:MAG: hypothetical protein GY717_11475 [Rhodobacteraceae bacterium]|nr:hypothetical protein [Paracoccaceae bacterium]